MPGGVANFNPAAMRRIRQQRRLSLDALADELGQRRPNVIAWEQGRIPPSPRNFRAIADALDVDAIRLLTIGPRDAELADLRACAGLTMQDVADAAGVTWRTYAQLEAGDRPLSDELARAVAKALGTTQAQVRTAVQRVHRRRIHN